MTEKGEDASSEPLEALLGSIEPFWDRLGSKVEAMFGSLEASHGLLEPLCLGCILSRIGGIFAVLPPHIPLWTSFCDRQLGYSLPSYRAMCSPNRFRKTSGNTWGRKRKKRKRVNKKKREDASSELVETLLGSIGPSWDSLGRHVLEAPVWPNVGTLKGFLARLTPSEAAFRENIGEEEKKGGYREKRIGGEGGKQRRGRMPLRSLLRHFWARLGHLGIVLEAMLVYVGLS